MAFVSMVVAEAHVFAVWLFLFGLWLVKDAVALIRAIYGSNPATTP
jgi:hypothetical protein